MPAKTLDELQVYSDRWTTIYNADCIEVMSLMDAGSIDMVMTSVPYWKVRNYGDDAFGFEDDCIDWLKNMHNMMMGCNRIMKPTAGMFLNIGDKYGGSGGVTNRMNRKGNLMKLPDRVVIQVMDEKIFTLVNEIIWHKPDSMLQSYTKKFVPTYEKMFYLVKDVAKAKFYRARVGVSKRNTGTELMSEMKSKNEDKPVVKQIGLFGEEEENKGLDPNSPPSFDSKYYKFWYENTRVKQSWHDHKNDDSEGQRIDSTRMKALKHPDGANPGDLWTITTPSDPIFKQLGKSDRLWPAWPRELCKIPILVSTDPNDVCFDPFSGSGTMAIVAKAFGRRSIICDVNYDSCMVAAQRILAEPEPLGLDELLYLEPEHPWAQWLLDEDE